MKTVLGIYQAIDPIHPLVCSGIREAFAFHEDNTILGYSILRAINYKSTGTTSYGPAHNPDSVCRKADDAVSGYFKSAIEPDGKQWTLTVYERSIVEAIHTSNHPTANDALLAGRKMLEQLATRKTLGQLEVNQWFSFNLNPDGTWSECYKYQGNGWHGRAYSGGPWHKPTTTPVYVLNDHMQQLCNKQEQSLLNLYSAERCEHTGLTREELDALCSTRSDDETERDIEEEFAVEQQLREEQQAELDGEGYDEDWEESLGRLPTVSERHYRGMEGGYADL